MNDELHEPDLDWMYACCVVIAKGPGPQAQGPRRRYACEELPNSIYENDQTASIKSHKFLASIKNVPKT